MESFGKIKRRFGFGGESIHKEPRCRKRRFLAVLISIVIVLGNPEFPGMGTLTACAASDEFQFDLNPDWNVDSIHPDEENIIELDVATGGVYEFEIRYETTNGETNLWADVVGLDGERQIHAGKVDFYNPNWWPFDFWGTHTFDLKLPRGKSTIHFF